MDWTTKRKFECGKSNCCSTHQQESGESLHSCLSATANNKVYFYYPVIFLPGWKAALGWNKWRKMWLFFFFFKLSFNWVLFAIFAYLGCVVLEIFTMWLPEELLSSFSGGSGSPGGWLLCAVSLALDWARAFWPSTNTKDPEHCWGALSRPPVQRARLDSEWCPALSWVLDYYGQIFLLLCFSVSPQ